MYVHIVYMGRTRSLYRIIIDVSVAASERGSIRPTNLLFAYSKISLKIVYSLVWHEMKVSFGPTNALIPILLPLLQCSKTFRRRRCPMLWERKIGGAREKKSEIMKGGIWGRLLAHLLGRWVLDCRLGDQNSANANRTNYRGVRTKGCVQSIMSSNLLFSSINVLFWNAWKPFNYFKNKN